MWVRPDWPCRRCRVPWDDRGMAKLDYDKLNSTTRYMMITAFAVNPGELDDDRSDVIDDVAPVDVSCPTAQVRCSGTCV